MKESKNILITGASGLIGTRLTELLLERGDHVIHLGRRKRSDGIPAFVWDIRKQTVDPEAFRSVDAIIHLAGAGVSERRWTVTRKKEIIESRTQSARLLYDTLRKQQHNVKCFISASGIGYYGNERFDYFLSEDDPAGNDFLAKVCQVWEREADPFGDLGMRIIKFRMGVVLSAKGGALKKLARPVRYFAGAPLGSGDQFMSWVHIDDVCGMFMKAIDDNNIQGVYNAVTPFPVTNREMTKAIASVLHKPLILPPVPGFVLKLVLGEMAEMVLTGNKISADKIIKAGFAFRFTSLEEALKDLFLNAPEDHKSSGPKS